MADLIDRQIAIKTADVIIQRDTSGNNDVVRAMKAWKVYIEALPSAQQWIPVSERLPDADTEVWTECRTQHGGIYQCEAVYYPRWTKKVDYDAWEECSEYNEEDDEYYVLEGWYERIHNWDEYAYVGIEDTVVAWLPLPEPWKGET